MQPAQIDNPRRRHLRFVFKDAVRSSDIPMDVTFQDVAAALDDLATSGYGRPVAIYLSLPLSDFAADVRQFPVTRLQKLRHKAGRMSYRSWMHRH